MHQRNRGDRRCRNHVESDVSLLVTLAIVLSVQPTQAQVTTNPYRAIYGWEKMPPGRKLGVVAGIYMDPDGKHLWMLSRCEGDGNACLNSKVDPILKFDLDGNLVKSFGAGMFNWPHGFFVDHEGNVWVTEGAPAGEARGAEGHKAGKGHQVFKFSPDGKVLMTLGEAGVPGDDQTHFNGPSHVFVAPSGEIWVTDGHRGGNNRLVKFDKDGKYIMQIGGGVKSATMERGCSTIRITSPWIRRAGCSSRIAATTAIQIFDQQGKHIAVWTQFGRPSAIAIDEQDRIYVVDGTSASPRPLIDTAANAQTRSGNPGVNNPGYESGIRIGDARTGWITEFIPEMPLTTTNGRLGRREHGVHRAGPRRGTSTPAKCRRSGSSSGCALENERHRHSDDFTASVAEGLRGDRSGRRGRGLRLARGAKRTAGNVLFAAPLVDDPGRRHRSSGLPSAGSTASAATTPRTRARWDPTRRASRRSSSRSRATPSSSSPRARRSIIRIRR